MAEGLEADVVTLNQPTDLDFRRGNPKGIKDWDDLVKPGVSVVIPNPKTSGNGRYTYLAAWGYAQEKLGSPEKAREFVSSLFANVPVFDGGGRGATTTFTQRAIGDVLVTFENEAALITEEVDGQNFDVVYPSLSVEAAPPVAVVETVAAKRKTEAVAKGYLDILYSDEAQKIIAKHHFRPTSEPVRNATASHFPQIKTFAVEDKLGKWADLQKTHFAEGGVYDQITSKSQ